MTPEELKAVEPRSKIYWNVSDALLAVWAIVAAASEGSSVLVWGPLVSTLVRKVWPIIERVAQKAKRGRNALLVLTILLNGTSLLGCGSVQLAGERDPQRCFLEAAGVAAAVAATAAKDDVDVAAVVAQAAIATLALYHACLEAEPRQHHGSVVIEPANSVEVK